VEGASLEEDPHLQEKWANLMANAADPRRKYDISPLFQSILRELSPRDAVFLDAIHKEWDRDDQVFPVGWTFMAQDLIRIFREAGLGPAGWLPHSRDQTSVEAEDGEETVTASEDFEISMDILTRTAILRPIEQTEPLQLGVYGDIAPAGDTSVQVLTNTKYAYTSFGQRFMRACRPPVKSGI
jgi:hypothetical protein